jgi:hypothetical protein
MEFIPELADLFNLDPRFQRFIRVEGSCWIWTGYKNWSGANKTIPYGRIWFRPKGTAGKPVYVHRYVWELFWGPYPRGHETHHTCAKTLCCNPSHFAPIEPNEHDKLHNHVANLGFRAKKKWLRQHKERLP